MGEKPSRGQKFFAAAFLILAAGFNPFALETESDDPAPVVKEASRLLIVDNGRIKPLAVYARSTLFELSGRSSCGKSSAIRWLCRVLFRPQEALDDPVILINDPAVADAIGIAPVNNRRYSLRTILPVIGRLESEAMKARFMEPADRSGVEKELLHVSLNVRTLLDLCGALTFAAVPRDSGVRSFALAMIPVEEDGALGWHAPLEMHAIDNAFLVMDPVAADIYKAEEDFIRRDYAACAAKIHSVNSEVRGRLVRHGIRLCPELEIFYTSLDPFFRGCLAYFVSLVLLITGATFRRKWVEFLGALALSGGLLLHTTGLILRMIIMHRPPVATFYETFVFVAWAGVLLGVLVSVFQKRNYGLLIAAFMGGLFLSFATTFSTGSDTMGMLAPVLNSNFWLAMHIITITTGYAGCLSAGLIGHLTLLRQGFPGSSSEREAGLQTDPGLSRAMWAMLATGLTFTTIGTVLGGMWAELAWGRFWGWDPKENGALLIILWYAILFHARSAGFLKRRADAFCVALAAPLVMLAWVGVNLLGIGMHSYGFTLVGAKILFGALGIDAAFLAILAGRLLYGGWKAGK
jgi:ABC-type transport system involved in cytochrome c biogenesis permease subunit